MAQLTSLDLWGNAIGDAGAASLAPSLATMAQLTSLNLGDNTIGDTGLAALAPSLARMTRLTSYDLGLGGLDVPVGANWVQAEVKYNGTWRFGAMVANACYGNDFWIARWKNGRGISLSQHHSSEVRFTID
jgi:hypothetical protein